MSSGEDAIKVVCPNRETKAIQDNSDAGYDEAIECAKSKAFSCRGVTLVSRCLSSHDRHRVNLVLKLFIWLV